LKDTGTDTLSVGNEISWLARHWALFCLCWCMQYAVVATSDVQFGCLINKLQLWYCKTGTNRRYRVQMQCIENRRHLC